jgi:hypothetical protein
MKTLKTAFILIGMVLFGCAYEVEIPLVDIKLAFNQDKLDALEHKLTTVAYDNGFTVSANDRADMAILNGGEPAFSLWILDGKKIPITITTVNESGLVRLMFYRSGFDSDESLYRMEQLFVTSIEDFKKNIGLSL